MKRSLLFVFLTFSVFTYAKDMERVDFLYENESRHYLKFVPNNYNANKPINLVIGLHGYTGSASGFEKETTGGFNKSATKHNFIAIYPQGLFFYQESYYQGKMISSYVSSWNDLTGSKTKTPNGETCAVDAVIYPKYPSCNNTDSGRCAWPSCGDDIGFIKQIIDQVKAKYSIDKVFVVGMSNGGKIAHALACEYPEILEGVINVVGSPQLGLGCKPKGPINYIIYGGLKDNIVPPYGIVSHDKYYYTPMNSIVNNWKDAFNCRDKKINKSSTPDNIDENIYYNCSKNVKVISLLNNDRGHTWPGTNLDSAGFCRTDNQTEINIQTCKNRENDWGNDFLLERLFNKL